MSALTLPGCLITQPVQFEPPAGTPSSIASPTNTDHPLDEIVRMTASDTSLSAFVVDVRDPDVDDELEYRVYIDRSDELRLSDARGTIPVVPRNAGVSRTTRRVPFDVPIARLLGANPLEGSCHRIELLVSTSFQSELPLPVSEGDLATAVWWVATEPTGGGNVPMTGCP